MHVATGSEEVSRATREDHLFLSEGIHEIMEIVPTVPKLDRLRGTLRGSEYGEEEWENEMQEEETNEQVRIQCPVITMIDNFLIAQEQRRYTRAELAHIIQASDHEFSKALKDNHILELEGT